MNDCPGQTARVTSNLHSSSSTMAVSRVPSPPLPEVNTPVAENWCYTQVSHTKIINEPTSTSRTMTSLQTLWSFNQRLRTRARNFSVFQLRIFGLEGWMAWNSRLGREIEVFVLLFNHGYCSAHSIACDLGFLFWNWHKVFHCVDNENVTSKVNNFSSMLLTSFELTTASSGWRFIHYEPAYDGLALKLIARLCACCELGSWFSNYKISSELRVSCFVAKRKLNTRRALKRRNEKHERASEIACAVWHWKVWRWVCARRHRLTVLSINCNVTPMTKPEFLKHFATFLVDELLIASMPFSQLNETKSWVSFIGSRVTSDSEMETKAGNFTHGD